MNPSPSLSNTLTGIDPLCEIDHNEVVLIDLVNEYIYKPDSSPFATHKLCIQYVHFKYNTTALNLFILIRTVFAVDVMLSPDEDD